MGDNAEATPSFHSPQGQSSTPLISVVITTYNEAEHIGECLRSVAWADERIVVDGESSDSTREIAASLGARVYVQPNYPMLNYNKNFGFAQANGEWVMSLDSDERVTPELREEILATLPHSTMDGYRVPLHNFFWGKKLRRAAGYPGLVTRIARRGKGRFGTEYVHQGLEVQGRVGVLSSPLHHYPAEDLYELIAKLNFNTTMTADYFNRKGARGSLLRACLYSLGDFFYRYLCRGAFIDGAAGFALCAVRAMYVFTWQMKLWESQKVGAQRLLTSPSSLPQLGARKSED